MKNWFKPFTGTFKSTLRKKFIFVFTLYVGLISAFIYFYFPLKLERQAIKFAADKAQSIAEITAFNVSPILVFEDREDMDKVLYSVKQNRDIVYLVILDSNGNIFSVFNLETAVKSDYKFMAREDPVSADGMTYRTSAPIFHNSGQIGQLFLGMSLENIRFQVARSKKTIAMVSIVIFTLGALAVFLISVVFTNPLKKMVRTIEHISAGDLSRRVTISANDEVGRLAASFNTMVAKLENYSRDLKHLNDELENKVMERTKKLQVEVNERFLAQEALKKSEEKYRNVVEYASEGIFVTQDLVFKYCNPRISEFIGFSQEELKNKHFAEIIHPEDSEMVLERYKRRLKGEQFHEFYSFRVITKDLQEKWVEIKPVLIQWEGKPATLNFVSDITQRKKAEDERQRLENQLLQAQKMQSIGTLAGGIAHDFNNILSAVIGYTELTLDHVADDDNIKFNLDRVLASANRAKEMVKQILAFGRKGEGERKPIQLKEVVEELLKLLRSTLPTTIEICQDLTDATNPVLANKSEMHRVLMNLCTNAAHAMKEAGGILSISLKEVDLAPGNTEGTDLEPGRYQQLSVGDTGVGMTPEIMSRIFEPYFTTKKEGEGTGMGLSVVHGIVKSCGGDITVHSTQGKGTIVNVFLPLSSEKRVEEITGQIEEVVRGGNENLLVVDDEPFIAELSKEVLADLGYHVTMKTGGIEALEAFKENPGKFDLVIADQTMPHMTGVQLTREMKKIRPDFPVILCTGFSDAINEDNYKLYGIDAFLMKPILPKELGALVRKMLG
jgi:PAS domain S-box-containing protein